MSPPATGCLAVDACRLPPGTVRRVKVPFVVGLVLNVAAVPLLVTRNWVPALVLLVAAVACYLVALVRLSRG
jgi:hypothetical protein